MAAFFLNDEEIEFEPGESVLHAALRRGVEIPHYCYHPGMSVVATCRMCLVEITDMGNGKGLPKLQASCATAAADGMKVSSTSEKVIAAQNEVNEFLLVNHPLDCPICDQAGECKLQDFAFDYGTGHSEMDYEKRVYGWRDVGTYIALERNRCVHCSRCERFSREIEGGHEFGMFLRTHELTFDTFEDHRITHPFQGNLVDICPVGAITEREFRFKKRVWKLNHTPSVCPTCATGCNIVIDHHRGHVERLKPRENLEVNRWWMCDYGRLAYRDLNDRESRHIEPQARVKGSLQAAAWEAVYAALAKKAGDLGASGEQVVGLADTHASNEELHQFRTLLGEGFNSEALFFPYRPGQDADSEWWVHRLINSDKSPNTEGAKAQGLAGDEDDKRVTEALQGGPKIVFVLGGPFADDAKLRDAAAKAELVVQIATRRDEWEGVADVILPGLTYAEKAGTFTNKQRRVQRFHPAIRPPDTARDQLVVMAELLEALGKPRPVDHAEGVLAALGDRKGDFAGITWDKVGDLGLPLDGEARDKDAAKASA